MTNTTQTQTPRRNNASRWNLKAGMRGYTFGNKDSGFRVRLHWTENLILESIYCFKTQKQAQNFANSLRTSGKVYISKWVKKFPNQTAAQA